MNKLPKGRLKELIEDSGMSRYQFAEKLGVKPNTVRMYMYGYVYPSTSILRKMAEILGVSTDYILGLSDVKNNVDASDKLIELVAEFETNLKETFTTVMRLKRECTLDKERKEREGIY